MSQADTNTNNEWYKDAIIYELHVRTFFDSTDDGIGDFLGLTQKLDYLQDLGINCLWLLPFYPSPLRDDGYDIADYFGVHPDYGTLETFKQFLEAAHKRGMRVLADLVINHTSDQHNWFKEARASSDPAKQDYYVWSDTDKKYQTARIIFSDTENSNWAWDTQAQKYYWHRFFNHQPDLNFDNPAVQDAIIEVIRYWLELGLDGFRVDAVPYLYEREGSNCENLAETHVYLKRLRAYVNEHYPDRVLLAEANQWPADLLPYFGDGDEFHMAFNFPLMPRIFMALRKEERRPIVDIINQLPSIPQSCQWAIFLRNHDELTLEMVTDEDRDYMYKEYASDARMKINVGIRRRLAPLLENSRRRIELVNSLLFSLPGTPVIYYGDELGMGDNIHLGDRNGVRTPMQWTEGGNAGFSKADLAHLCSPIITDPTYTYQFLNVETQLRAKTSLLNWMKRMIAVRQKYTVFGRGDIRFLNPTNQKILAYVREYEDQKILIVNNLSRFVQPVELDLADYKGATPIEMIGETRFPAISQAPYFLSLGPHSFYWLRLD